VAPGGAPPPVAAGKAPGGLTLARALAEAARNWLRHGATLHSAALAFYTIFALAPVLLLVIAIAGALFGREAVRVQIMAEFGELMGSEAARTVDQVLESAARPSEGALATVVGSVTLLFGATAVFAQLQAALNAIWEVEPQPGSFFGNFLRKRFVSFAVVVCIGFLLLVSLTISALVAALGNYLEMAWGLQPALLEAGNFALTLAVTTLLFALIFRLLPDVRIAWRSVWIGALTASLLFAAGKTLIGLYLGQTGLLSVYGAAGSAILVLVWVYYSSLIVLLGAEVSRVYAEWRQLAIRPEPGAVRRITRLGWSRRRRDPAETGTREPGGGGRRREGTPGR